MGSEQKVTLEAKSQESRGRGTGVAERFIRRHACTQMHTHREGGKKGKKKEKDI